MTRSLLSRRLFAVSGLTLAGAAVASGAFGRKPAAHAATGMGSNLEAPLDIAGFPDWTEAQWSALTAEDWKARLSEDAYRVLRRDGTERAFTSPLNSEKRDGWYACAGCGQVLFSSDHKYDSGTGWPSFYQAVEGRLGTSVDRKLFYPRTEYHCSRCGGHQGHVFNDGPAPTGQRWCNNGVALVFEPSTATPA